MRIANEVGTGLTEPTASNPTWRQKHLWPKRIIAIIVICLTLWPVYEYTQVTTPEFFIPETADTTRTYPSSAGFTIRLFAHLIINFTAKGSLSVNNPVSISSIIIPNDTSFMDHYYCMGFTNAYNASNKLQFSCLLFNPLGNGAYSSEGRVVWLVEGPSYLIIAPKGNYTVTESTNLGNPIINISAVSDSLSIASTENNERLTWVLIAFSFLSLQLLIEALCIDDRKEKPTTSPTKSKKPNLPSLKFKSRFEKWRAKRQGHSQSPQSQP